MSITAAQFIAEHLERRTYGAADRRALRKEATAVAPANPHGRAARAERPRRAFLRLRLHRVAHG